MKEKKEFVGVIMKAIPVVFVAALLSMTSIGNPIVGMQNSNLSPTADAGGPYSGWTGETIVFDGRGSYDPSGTIINYTWDFGDGHKGYGNITTHVYPSAGTYTVTLAVLSDAYEMDTDSTYAYIYEHNWAPVANAGGPYYGDVGVPIAFNGCNSYDSDGYIVSYSWGFGDGYSGSGRTPSHVYSSPGTYIVTLTVTDDDGATDSDSAYAYVGTNQHPVADAGGPYSGDVGQTIVFDGSGSYDPDGTIVSYIWDFGDGTGGSGEVTTHSYSMGGTHTVTLTVTDNDGATDIDTTSAIIPGGNQAPAIPQRPAGPTVGYIWNTYTYMTYTTDPQGDKIRYCFDWGDCTTSWTLLYDSGEAVSAQHSWTYQGSYHIRVKAEDEHGAQSDWSEPLSLAMPLGISASPTDGGLYIFGRKILDIPNTIVIGSIVVETSLENENPLKQVEFYVDKTLKHTAYYAPYSWTISEPLVGSHTLKVIAYDKEGYEAIDSMDITFFIFGRGSQLTV
ncbi:MAG: PKD domain-containing protein [Candidatus Thermoplasmatota archaeon]|nr:PKD domain-containing protein [Candidatus Thermoplasmatota archaeon]